MSWWRNPWLYRVAYIAGVVILVGAEVAAIVNDVTGDTITENTRNVIFVHPLIWWTAIGLWFGIGIWVTRHFWWRKK